MYMNTHGSFEALTELCLLLVSRIIYVNRDPTENCAKVLRKYNLILLN